MLDVLRENFLQLSSFWYTTFFLYFFILMAFVYTVIFITATPYIISRYREKAIDDVYSLTRSDSVAAITFIVPAFNECKNIAWTVRNLLNLSYRYKKIIVVNDGSTDETLEILIKHFALVKIPLFSSERLQTKPIIGYYRSQEYADLMVIDKVNGGKADSLNAALNICQTPLFASTDADTLIEDTCMNYLMRPFLENKDTLVVHSSVGIVNGCKLSANRITKRAFPRNMLAAFQVIEYIRTFYCDRMCWEWSKGSLIVAGVFAFFKTDTVLEVGGYSTKSVVEDMEVIMKIHKKMGEENREYHIRFVPDIVAWTEVPTTLLALKKQRLRWYTGTTQCLYDYRKMCFDKRFKSIGLFVVPFYIFDKIIPIVELVGYLIVIIFGVILGVLDLKMFLILGLVCWGYSTLLSFALIIVEELTFRKYPDFWGTLCLLGYALFENLTYRFYILYLKLRGLIITKKAGKHWLVTPRKGYNVIGG